MKGTASVKRRPQHVDDIAKRLRDWSRASWKFRRVATLGTARVSTPTPTDKDAGFDAPVYRHKDIFGREHVTSVADAKLFRRTLARLIREARARERRQDWDWFWWLNEYGLLVSQDIRDDFDELYTPAIEAHGANVRRRQRNQRLANDRRKAEADDEMLKHFCEWQRRVRMALKVRGQPMTAAERVRKYIATGQVPADRKKRRIHALLKADKIPPLE